MASVYSEEYQLITKILREARIRMGMTQATLASTLGHPQSFVAKIESGERRIDVVEFVHIASLLRIDYSAILDKIVSKKHIDKSILS